MCNGKIIAAFQEERFSKIKNHIGYPKKSIESCLQTAGINSRDLGLVVFTSKDLGGWYVKAKFHNNLTLKGWDNYYGEQYFGKKINGGNALDYKRNVRDSEEFNKLNDHFDFSYLNDDKYLSNNLLDAEEFRRQQIQTVRSHINISEKKIEFLDHHTCHANYAYFGSPFRGEPCIAVTLDANGDGRNMTVWSVKDDKLELLSESSENDIGRIYKMATLILGMKPGEHEFKVMGLAAYAKDQFIDDAIKILDNILLVDDMKIIRNKRPRDLYKYLIEGWALERFDNIAGAVQRYTEKIAIELFEDIYRRTGITRYVLSGGVSMNIKMNKVLSELDFVDEFFVCGSGADESLPIGGCYYANARKEADNYPIQNMYLGYDIDIELERYNFDQIEDEFNVVYNPSVMDIASLIADGEIVAIAHGRAEFGSRALGNRSILADPRTMVSVTKINKAIKNRDFWMPFALSILEERSSEYIHNPKNISSPFMAIALDAKQRHYEDIKAGTHSYDYTVRPQFVSKKENKKYYEIISAFCDVTGVPALLNTSFNLNSVPIVNNIEDSIQTFRKSELDHLYISNKILISK